MTSGPAGVLWPLAEDVGSLASLGSVAFSSGDQVGRCQGRFMAIGTGFGSCGLAAPNVASPSKAPRQAGACWPGLPGLTADVSGQATALDVPAGPRGGPDGPVSAGLGIRWWRITSAAPGVGGAPLLAGVGVGRFPAEPPMEFASGS